MIRFLVILFIALPGASGFAQKIDSVKYADGFLFYHDYENTAYYSDNKPN